MMIKTKYQRLSKEEKKDARTEFFSTPFGTSLKNKLNRLIIYSILLFLFGIYLLIDSNSKFLEIFYGIVLLIISILFLIGRHNVIGKKVNDYITKDKDKKKK